MILTPGGSDGEIHALAAAQKAIADRIEGPGLDELKARLAREMESPDFWSRPERAQVLSRLALIDRVGVAAAAARSLQDRLARRTSGAPARELVARLALQVHLVTEGLRDVEEAAPVDVALTVEPAFEGGAPDRAAAEAWCADIVAMYRGWAKRRNMQLEVIERRKGREQPILVVTGFGAWRRLSAEAGLHVLEHGETNGAGRLTARVLVASVPTADMPKARLAQVLGESIIKMPRPGTLVRRYRRGAAPLVRSGDGGWRSGRLDAVLAGDFDLLPELG